MKKIKNCIYKLRIKLLIFRNFIYRKTRKFGNNLVIASSDKYVNKVKEDINLCYYLMKSGIDCEIKSWKNIDKDENVIIRSVWGYQDEVDSFKEFLNNRKGITINSLDIINKNISKKEQYDLFKKYDVNCIDTKFVYDIKDVNINGKSVIKPIISASGNKTFIVENIEDVQKVEDINKGYMVQPYIKDVQNGEYSVILLDKEIMYGIKRYPGIFTDKCSVEYVNQLDDNISEICNKVNGIKEYEDYVFMRIDIVDNKVIEVELLDPQLFIETIPDRELRNNIYKKFVTCIEKRLK